MARTYVIAGSASGVGAAAQAKLEVHGHRVIGIDFSGAEISADLGRRKGRSDAVREVLERTDSLDAVIASAGLSAPIATTVAVNYFGVVNILGDLRPLLAKSPAPRAVVVSSMATLQPNSPELVDACLAGDEARAMELAQALEAEGPEVGYLSYPSSKRAISRWVRRESITQEWAG